MKSILSLIVALGFLLIAPGNAQIGPQLSLANSPAYEAAAATLRSAPARQYSFSKAVLGDVMRLMAEDAGIGFFGLPEGADSSNNLITFTLNASPFVALETLAKANGVTLMYENGIWYLRPANDQELIGRIYEINYNAQELVTKNTQSSPTNGGSGSSNTGTSSAGLNLQGSPDFFVVEPSRILEDIQNILDIPTTGSNGLIAPTASVDNIGQLSLAGFQGQPDLAVRLPGNGATGHGNADTSGQQSKVIWNSDSNTLYVVASRQQHQWIEAYLASADRPQPMIAVEVKFIETSRDPRSELGIDWDGVLGENGLQVSLTDNGGPLDLNRVGGYSLPTAVLSYSDLNLKLRAIYSDRKTRMVSYPRMVTLDNREVSFRSVINQPVLGTSASASLGAGATETSSIEYLPIGTVINILPKRMAGNKIHLNVSVTVSDIVGTEYINGNPFPIATSRVYTAPLTVQSGYTVAISGLDAARTDENERGLPILGRLPVIGYAFKNRKLGRNRQHLMMLITPLALSTGTEGLTEKPITREPWKAAPTHVPVTYGKAPVQEAGQYSTPISRTEPIADIPKFGDNSSSRKASRTFGRDEGESVVAVPVTITERSTGARIEYPAPPAPIQSGTSFGAPASAPKPAYVEAPSATQLTSAPQSVTAPRPSPPSKVSGDTMDKGITMGNAGKEAVTNPETDSTPSNAGGANMGSSSSSPEQVAPKKADAPKEASTAKEKTTSADAVSAPADPSPQASSATPTPQTSSAPEVATAEKDGKEDPRLVKIRGGIEKLQSDLNKIPGGDGKLSADDAQLVLNVHNEAQKLLGDVEEVRGDKTRPLSGGLGDAWWDLINVKSNAAKLSKRSPESLGINPTAGEASDKQASNQTSDDKI